MKTTIISYENAPYENDLVRQTMEWMEIDDVLDMFQGDPDQLRIEGETVFFIDIEDKEKGIRSVVFVNPSYKDEDIIIKMLSEFYAEDEDGEDIFSHYYEAIDNSWVNMKGLWNGIAYRGGEGYSYGLHQYRDLDKIFW